MLDGSRPELRADATVRDRPSTFVTNPRETTVGSSCTRSTRTNRSCPPSSSSPDPAVSSNSHGTDAPMTTPFPCARAGSGSSSDSPHEGERARARHPLSLSARHRWSRLVRLVKRRSDTASTSSRFVAARQGRCEARRGLRPSTCNAVTSAVDAQMALMTMIWGWIIVGTGRSTLPRHLTVPLGRHPRGTTGSSGRDLWRRYRPE
jgi:hypothetical protein